MRTVDKTGVVSDYDVEAVVDNIDDTQEDVPESNDAQEEGDNLGNEAHLEDTHEDREDKDEKDLDTDATQEDSNENNEDEDGMEFQSSKRKKKRTRKHKKRRTRRTTIPGTITTLDCYDLL